MIEEIVQIKEIVILPFHPLILDHIQLHVDILNMVFSSNLLSW